MEPSPIPTRSRDGIEALLQPNRALQLHQTWSLLIPSNNLNTGSFRLMGLSNFVKSAKVAPRLNPFPTST
jgi:hypothetical protein